MNINGHLQIPTWVESRLRENIGQQSYTLCLDSGGDGVAVTFCIYLSDKIKDKRKGERKKRENVQGKQVWHTFLLLQLR